MERQRGSSSRTILKKKKKKARGLRLPSLKTFCNISKRIDAQINGTEYNSEVKACEQDQLSFDRSTKAIQWEKGSLSTNGGRTIGNPQPNK